MAIQVNNISGSTAVELIDINTGIHNIKTMTIANTYSAAITVDLYLRNEGGDIYYIFKSLSIPNGQTLKLESDEVSFDNTIYNFYIKMGGGSDTASVIIKY